LRCDRLAAHGIDPLPAYVPATDDGGVIGQQQWRKQDSLNLISGAAHHFTTSTFANQAALVAREGEPFVEIHPDDAGQRGIAEGDRVVVENGRGSAELIAKVTDAVRPGVLASPKGRWAKGASTLQHGGRNINWTTPDALGDLAGQSTFHTNRVWIRKRQS
jgi:anaerobic selenocysteine-containing dehydrogenase